MLLQKKNIKAKSEMPFQHIIYCGDQVYLFAK